MQSTAFLSEALSSKNASGNHATCHDHPSDKRKILLHTDCEARLSMAKGEFPDTPYFPVIKKEGEFEDKNVYSMEKYVHITRDNIDRLNNIDKNIFMNLQSIRSIGHLIRAKGIPEYLRKAIFIAFKRLERKGYDVVLDMCDHNMMMTKAGKLVLNDLFWIEKEEV